MQTLVSLSRRTIGHCYREKCNTTCFLSVRAKLVDVCVGIAKRSFAWTLIVATHRRASLFFRSHLPRRSHFLLRGDVDLPLRPESMTNTVEDRKPCFKESSKGLGALWKQGSRHLAPMTVHVGTYCQARMITPRTLDDNGRHCYMPSKAAHTTSLFVRYKYVPRAMLAPAHRGRCLINLLASQF